MMNTCLKSTLLWLLLGCGILQESVAQRIFFRNYTVADGLCSSTIWDIEQDDQGYMWFGTKYGLNRFDGYDFKSYQYHRNVPGSIGNNFIRKIFKYDKKTFWIATDKGIYVFDLETEKFSLFKPIGNLFIYDIIRTSDSKIWIASKEKGVFRYNPSNTKLKNYSFSAGSKKGVSSNEISKLLEDSYGNIWIGTYGKGIDIYNPKNGSFRNLNASGESGLSNDVILSLLKDASGTIWVGTMSGGLNKWDKKTGQFKALRKSNTNSISDNIVRDIHQSVPGFLYLATEKGMNIYNIEKDLFTSYKKQNNDPYSISDDAVYSIFKDREGGMWVGTFFGGLNYYHSKGQNIEYYYPSGLSNSLSGNAVSAILETKPGQFWVGTEDGGLNYFNADTRTFKKYPFSPGQDNLSYHNIHALYKDKLSNIWVGMYTGGLNILNPVTGNIKRYLSDPDDPTTLSDNSIYSIDEDRQGRIWVSTISGLNLYNTRSDNFIRIKGKALEKSCIYQVYQDKEGIIWIATYDNGLVRMDQNGKLRQYSFSDKPGSISSNKVISILDDDNGNLWLGTDGGGLNLFNKRSGLAKEFDERDGINTGVIYAIRKDQFGKLWLSTNSGIYQFDPELGKTGTFRKWDKLLSQQYNYKASYKASDGKLYFGGINGFYAFYPEEIENIENQVKVSFTNFQLFNKDLKLDDEGSPLKKTLNYSPEIKLEHYQSVMSFEYAALSFISPDKAQYAFMMEGFDKSWNFVGNQRKATYTNLPPGDYIFKVMQAGGRNTRFGPASLIKITIYPPIYKTVAAYVIYLLLFVSGLFILRKYELGKAKRRNEIKLERLKNKSEQEFYKQKIEFFTAMAHEIRTPLSLIIAPLEKLLTRKRRDQETREQLLTMDENADRLLTLVNQLLDFRRIESDIFEIHTEQIELVSFVGSIKDRFSAISYQKGLDFSMSSSIANLTVQVDPEALNKILSNLLINAFKFTRKCVRIQVNNLVQFEDKGEMISLSIEDDGIGIPREQIDSIFKKFFKVSSDQHQYSNLGGTGIGLALAKSLTEKHGGQLLVESQEGIKTTFTVLIPYKVEEIPAAIALPDEDTVLPNGKPVVLVVEDDPSLLEFLIKSLETDGYHALKAKNGTDALEQMDRCQIDIVISDVMMPEMDGIELCRRIKNDLNYSHLPVILLTAKTHSETEIEGLESGADAYITKPFKWKQVSLMTRNLLELQHNLKQRFAQHPFESAEILPSGSKDKKFLAKLIECIEERISDSQLSVEELGKELGLSRSSLYKKVKALTGQVPNEFIRIIRLKNAARLLALHEYNISEIGYMVGFSSHSYFSKCFFQQFKLTPSEFAESNKKPEDAELPE